MEGAAGTGGEEAGTQGEARGLSAAGMLGGRVRGAGQTAAGVARGLLPRFRPDQILRLGWLRLLPASIVNVVLTAIGIVWLGVR